MTVVLSIGCTSNLPPLPSATPVNLPIERVYLFRGFIGRWSHGLDTLAAQLRDRGIDAEVYPHTSWDEIAKRIEAAPGGVIILVGHSWGADDGIRLARRLERSRIRVRLLVTLDPVTPPRVPASVDRAINFYESNGVRDMLPWWRGVALSADRSTTPLINIDVRHERSDLGATDVKHGTITDSPGIQREILRAIIAN